MAQQQACGDSRPHGPHVWSEPTQENGKTVQVQYQCPGVAKDK